MSQFQTPPTVAILRCWLFAILFFIGGIVAKAEESTVVCPTCGQAMPAKFHFCSNCGTNLDGAAKPGSKPESASAPAEKKKSSLLDLFSFNSSANKPGGDHSSAFSDVPLPLQPETPRPQPIIQIGQNPFLGNGTIAPGFTLPTGAVWQPVFIAYGTARSAFQVFDDGKQQITEWANRLDLLGNLYLTPTERILVGIRPLDQDGHFSGYRYYPDPRPIYHFNGNVHTLFFEGDFGQIFRKLDINDTRSIDYGFAVGRQPLSIEDGIMINDDAIDGVGITRTSLFALGASAVRATLFFGWNEINRNNDIVDNKAKLIGLFTAADYPFGTVDFDAAYVDDPGADGLYLGAGLTQRFLGFFNSTFRVNSSIALDHASEVVSNGTLLTETISTTLPHGKDVLYLDVFWGIDNYSSADRGPDAAAPLGTVGILFAAQDLGNYAAPLGDRPNSAVGAALGFQKFLDGSDKQIVLEIGGRTSTRTPAFFAESNPNELAAAARYQMKLNQHCVLIFDTFVGFPQDRDRDTSYGGRAELLIKF